MKKIHHFEHDRRKFITKIMPACVVTCLSLGGLPAHAAQMDGKNAALQDKHPFDMDFGRKLTYRELYERKHKEFIAFAKNMEKELGKEKLIEILKKYSKRSSRIMIVIPKHIIIWGMHILQKVCTITLLPNLQKRWK